MKTLFRTNQGSSGLMSRSTTISAARLPTTPKPILNGKRASVCRAAIIMMRTEGSLIDTSQGLKSPGGRGFAALGRRYDTVTLQGDTIIRCAAAVNASGTRTGRRAA